MILDFTKLFPKSCAKLGIECFYFDISELKSFSREYKNNIGFKSSSSSFDVVQIGNKTYSLPPLDDGVIVLSSIVSAKNLLDQFESNVLDVAKKESLQRELDISRSYLQQCLLKYGTDIG